MAKSWFQGYVQEEMAKALKDLLTNGKDPVARATAKSFVQRMLNGEEAPSSVPVETPEQQAEKYNDSVDAFKKPMKRRVLTDYVLPIVGDVASGVGDITASYNSILGSALQALANSMASQKKKEVYGGGITDGATGLANAGLKAIAATAKTAGDLASNRLYKTAATERAEEDAARAKAYNALYGGTNEFWRAQNKTTVDVNDASKRG